MSNHFIIPQKLINSANISGMEFIQLVCEQKHWEFPVQVYSEQLEEYSDSILELAPGIAINSKYIYGYSVADLYHTAETLWYWEHSSDLLIWWKLFSKRLLRVSSLGIQLYTLLFFWTGLDIFFQLNWLRFSGIWAEGLFLAATWVAAIIFLLNYWFTLNRISGQVLNFIKEVLTARFVDDGVLRTYYFQLNRRKLLKNFWGLALLARIIGKFF